MCLNDNVRQKKKDNIPHNINVLQNTTQNTK